MNHVKKKQKKNQHMHPLMPPLFSVAGTILHMWHAARAWSQGELQLLRFKVLKHQSLCCCCRRPAEGCSSRSRKPARSCGAPGPSRRSLQSSAFKHAAETLPAAAAACRSDLQARFILTTRGRHKPSNLHWTDEPPRGSSSQTSASITELFPIIQQPVKSLSVYRLFFKPGTRLLTLHLHIFIIIICFTIWIDDYFHNWSIFYVTSV